MDEPTIACPNCKTETKLTESPAGPPLEATRWDFEICLRQRNADLSESLIEMAAQVAFEDAHADQAKT